MSEQRESYSSKLLERAEGVVEWLTLHGFGAYMTTTYPEGQREYLERFDLQELSEWDRPKARVGARFVLIYEQVYRPSGTAFDRYIKFEESEDV